MIQNIIAAGIGAIVTFLLLLLFDGGARIVTDENTAYLVAVIIGAIATVLWPLVLGIWMGRRVKARREDSIEAEVQRQLSEQQRKP